MKFLPTTRWIMTWLYMYPASEQSSTRDKILYKVSGVTIFGVTLCSVMVCVAFIWKNIATDLVASLFAFLGAVTFGSSLYAIPIAILSRYQAHTIFNQLSTIHDANVGAPGICFMLQANSIGEWVWPLAIKLTLFYDCCNVCLSVATAIYCQLTYGRIESDRVYHSMNAIYPWEQTTFLGYLGGAICITTFGNAYAAMLFVLLLLFVSICLQHRAFAKMFNVWIDEWNCQRHQGDTNAKEFLCNLIRFHISVKDWFMLTVDFYSPFILVQLIANVLMLATVIFEFDLQLRSHFDYTLLILIMGVSMGMLSMFIYCYFGKLATESFEQISDCVYDLNWHEMSLNLQKYIVIMISDMQEPLHYHGFKVAILNLNTFLRLIKTIFSYYMAFKTLTTK